MPKTYKSWANGYKALIDTTFKKGKDYRQGVFYIDTTENWDDRLVEVGGIDEFERWDEGDRASRGEIHEGYDKRFTQVPFGKEIAIGRLAKKFQAKDMMLTKRASIQLGKRAYRLMQRAPFSIFGYGFADTNTYLTNVTGEAVSALGPDGKRFFSTLHPCSPTNSDTWSNALSDNAGVSPEALEAMMINLHDQLDDQGQKKHYGEDGFIWLVPMNKYFDALEIVGSDNKPDTGDNNVNVFAGGSFNGKPVEVRMVPWMSEFSTTAHVLVAKEVVEEETPVVMLSSEDFYTDDYTDDATKTAYVRGQMTFVTGFLSGRGYCGSQGTDSGTYSA